MGLKKAQKLFNVPKTSLRPYVSMKDKPSEEAVLTKLGRGPVFSRDLENS
jgi:ribosomal protein L13E